MSSPPAEDGWRPDLVELRARLDEIDDRIHDLLMARARVVESVARSGKPAAFRPGREASILRRLVARHAGGLPARTLIRMWREMLAGTTAMQTPVTVAVFDPDPSHNVEAIAREHFGFLTPVQACPSAAAALDKLRAGTVSVAILPFPLTASIWDCLTDGSPRLHVVARLPFWAHRPDHVPGADALVIGTAAPDASEAPNGAASGAASGADRSFLALRNATEASGTPIFDRSHPDRSSLDRAAFDHAKLAAAGITLHAMHGAVAEVEGMIADDDPRLPSGVIALGGYAIPVAEDAA